MVDRERLERLVGDAFRRVLHVDDIGVDDDFFLLGGHSFLVVRMVRLVGEAGVHVDYDVVFTGRSVRGIVDLLVTGDEQLVES